MLDRWFDESDSQTDDMVKEHLVEAVGQALHDVIRIDLKESPHAHEYKSLVRNRRKVVLVIGKFALEDPQFRPPLPNQQTLFIEAVSGDSLPSCLTVDLWMYWVQRLCTEFRVVLKEKP